MRLLKYGRSGLLVELDSLDEVLRLTAELDADRPAGVSELIPGARTVLIRFDPARTGLGPLAAHLARRPAEPIGPPGSARSAGSAGSTGPTESGRGSDRRGGGEQVEIPVCYDGPDLAAVAEMTGLSTAEVVRRHSQAHYRVAFTGFAPGFGYLSGGDPALVVPRRSTPRTRVRAGAVGLAGEFTGVYPRPGPGGWQLIGHTDVTMWDVDRTPAALLRPGVTVVFRAVGS
jgi:allophanate hydrolase subunit 1